MARGFSRSGGGRFKPPQRQITNLGIDGEIDGTVLVVGTVKAAGTTGIATIGSGTIVRTRGQLSIHAEASPASQSIVRGAFGIILVSSDAFAAAVVPGPMSDSENDWYVWVPFAMNLGATVVAEDILANVRIDFDSRGMRKSKTGDVSAVIIEYVSDVAGGTMDLSYALREQFKS